ncbi:hypothetical protein JXA63_04440 [Candidatus Woesebacteria bacterium]|nr:hypothetical protein [Candidatus Woesebacteria bacterium]
MNIAEIFRIKKTGNSTPDPLQKELSKVQYAISKRSREDPYYNQLLTNLEIAQYFGLEGEYIVHSCRDLAELAYDPTGDNFVKKQTWMRAKETVYMRERTSGRMITMKLYPQYYAAIQRGFKTFEGRAYDPQSSKRYADIKKGDAILFEVNKEIENWEEECKHLSIDPDKRLETDVGQVFYGALVHEVFQMCPRLGVEFQPMISGPSELINLQRAAVYYSFPEYSRRISENGFIGIEVLNPRLVD